MKSDYKKSMLRLGAVVVASASMLGAASIANAAPIAAPLPAAEEAEELSENQIALGNDMAKIEALQEKLTDVLKTLEDKYPTFEEGNAMANEIYGKIVAMQDKCIADFDALGEDEAYVSPITDTWEQEIEDDINNIPVQAEYYRILTNENAYNAYIDEVKKLNDELAAATAATKPYAKFLNRGKVESVQTEINILGDDATEEYEENKAEDDYWFPLNISDSASSIRGQIAQIVADAEAALEAERVANVNEAYGNYVTDLSYIQQYLSTKCGDEKAAYYDFLNHDKVQGIYNELEALNEEAEEAYNEALKEGEFTMTIDKDEYIANIDNMVRQAENALAYSGVIGKIDALKAKVETAFSDKEEYFPFIPEETLNKINKEIEDLEAEAEYQKRATADSGSFDATEMDATAAAIEAEIDAAVKQAKLDNFEEKERLAKNEEAYKNFMDGVQVLRDKLAAAIAEDQLYADYINYGLAESIESAINELADEAEEEYAKVAKEGHFNLSIEDSANTIEGMINGLVEKAIEAQEANRVKANDEAYGAVVNKLVELQGKISYEMSGEQPYQAAPYMDATLLESLYNEAAALYNDAEEAYAEVEKGGLFTNKFDVDACDTKIKTIESTLAKVIEKAQQAYDTDRKDKNKAAYEAYMDTIQDLRDKLAAATDENQPYARLLNWGVAESIANEITALEEDGQHYYAGVEEAGIFDLNIEDEATMIKGEINAMVAKAKAAIEADRKTQNLEMNDIWNDAINRLDESFAKAFADDTDYYRFLSQKAIANVKAEIDALKAERQTEWDKCVDEEDYYFPALGDKASKIQTEIDNMVDAAKAEYNLDRVNKNTKAYDACMAIISDLRTELAEAIDPELPDHEYVQYLDRALNTKVTSEIDELVDEIELEKTNTEKEGFFGLNIDDSANAIRGQIQAAVEEAKKIAADPNGYFNKEAYAYDTNLLFQMQQDYTALWESLQQTSPDFYESEYGKKMAENIYDELNDMHEKVEAAWEAVEGDKDAIYESPIPEDFEENFAKRCEDLQHMAQVFADNAAARQADAAAVEAIMGDLETLATELDELDANWMENEKANDLYHEIDRTLSDYYNGANEAWQASLKTGEYIAPFTEEDLDDVKTQMEDLRAMVEQVVYNNTAYGNDVTKLSEMQQDLTALWESFAQSSPDFYESAYGEALAQVAYNVLKDAKDAADASYAEAEEGGAYVSPINEAFEQDFNEAVDNLQHMAQVFVENNEAMLADQDKVNALNDEVFELGDKLDALDPEWMENEEAAALGDEIRDYVKGLYKEIEGAYTASMKTGEYISPIDEESFADIREVMTKLYDLVKANVAANNAAYNEAAFGAEFSLLVSLQEQLSNVWNEIVEVYSDFENFGAAIALRTNLYNDLDEKANAVEAEHDRVAAEGGIYETQLPYTFQQEILDGIEQLQALAEQFGVAYDEWQSNANEAYALNAEWWPFLDELDSIYAEWMDNEEANDLYWELDGVVTAMLNDCNAAWNAFLKTGEYIAPFDQQDIDDFRAKMEELRNLVIETGVATISELDADAEFYTIDGQKLSRPVRGMVNIVRTGDKVQKIFIK